MICNIPNIGIQSITADPKFKEILEKGGYAAEGVETAFQKYADLLKNGLIEPGKEKDAAVKAFADSYQWLSDRANTWLNDLPANGPKAEAYKNSVAQSYVGQTDATYSAPNCVQVNKLVNMGQHAKRMSLVKEGI